MQKQVRALSDKLKKKLYLILISVGICSFCAVALVNHYSSRESGIEDWIMTMEHAIFDTKLKLRGPVDPDEYRKNGKVGILAIDEKSLQAFNRWPLDREVYEPALKNLKKLGVEWIGMDVVWSEPESPQLLDVIDNFRNIEASVQKPGTIDISPDVQAINELIEVGAGDRALARMVQEYQKVVLGFFYFQYQSEAKHMKNPFRGLDSMVDSAVQAVIFPDGYDTPNFPSLAAHGVVANIPYLNEQAEHFAFFSNDLDQDSVVRWVTMVKFLDGNLFPSLSLKLAAKAKNMEPAVFFDTLGIEDINLFDLDDDSITMKIPIDPAGKGRLLINHLGPSMTIPHFSLSDAYYNTFTDEEKAQLKGRHLILGPTAIGINDLRPSPFDASMMGVENHAAAVDNIITENFLVRSTDSYRTELILVIVLGVFFTPIMIWGRALQCGLFAALFLAGYATFDWVFWWGQGKWVYMGMPFVEIGSLFIGTTLYKYAIEEREKRKLKGQFEMYLSPEVINQLQEDPSAAQSKKREMTVFFSDVRGFTSISEKLSPEKLVQLMNLYFNPMTAIITDTKGCVDKFIGDAIMAFWGAPIDSDDHADKAAEASVQMLFELEKIRADFKQRGFPPIDIGIGLNTGPMVVGNMGSDKIVSYTVMGDSVNLGSRLEGLTKEYGIKIMISEFTYARMTHSKFRTRELDKIKVKGKDEPVTVYELLRPDYLQGDHFDTFLGEWQLARAAYLARDWDTAEKHFSECQLIRPDDGPVGYYYKQIEVNRGLQLDENWDGVRKFNHK